MTYFGKSVVVSPTNNWKKMHGLPMNSTKRYPHERKDMPKDVRIMYHAMKRAGCDMELIRRFILKCKGFVLD